MFELLDIELEAKFLHWLYQVISKIDIFQDEAIVIRYYPKFLEQAPDIHNLDYHKECAIDLLVAPTCIGWRINQGWQSVVKMLYFVLLSEQKTKIGNIKAAKSVKPSSY